MRQHKLLLVLTILVLRSTTPFASESDSTSVFTGEILFKQQSRKLNVFIAATPELREKGLMFQTQLSNENGMLFVFETQSIQHVWMKNTLIPLDILFLSQEGIIQTMLENLLPCQTDACQIYASGLPATYMLEVNAGFIKSNHIKVGEKIQLPF